VPVSDNLVDVYVHLVVGLLGNKVVEHHELLVVLLNPDATNHNNDNDDVEKQRLVGL